MSIRTISIIHSDSDRTMLLKNLKNRGLELIDPHPTDRHVRLCSADDAPDDIYVTHPSWRFAPLQIYRAKAQQRLISFIQPQVNFCCFQFYLPVQKHPGRLSAGELSAKAEWYRTDTDEICPCGSDFISEFEHIRSEIKQCSNFSVGKRRYFVMKDALDGLQDGRHSAPFSFMESIDWLGLKRAARR